MTKRKENKILKYIKQHKILISVISLILVLIITGTTLAIFLTSGEGTDKTYTLGNVDVKYNDGKTFKVDNSIPLADYEIEEYAAKKEFSFENIGNITMYAEILLTDIEISENLKNKNFVWELYEENNSEYKEITSGNFKEIKDNKLSLKKGIEVTVEATPKNYKILVYIRDNGGDQNAMMTSHMSCKVTVTATDKPTEYVDNSGANPPKLADGMIPVIYDEDADTWVKANAMKKWYDYDEQWWANAVTVYSEASNCGNNCVDNVEKHNREYYLKAKAGTPISMDDINSMWVWVPRYKYRIPSNIGYTTATPPEIDVVFETGLSATGVSEAEYRENLKDCTSNCSSNVYYTHPAFRDGSEIYNYEPYDIGGWNHELTGIWVGKFDTGTDTNECNNKRSIENCKNVDPIIKPNQKALINQNLSTQFKTALKFGNGTFDDDTGEVTFAASENNKYGLNANVHMIKNTEWGAIAYLSQSKYGKMGNKNYDDLNKEIYTNNSNIQANPSYTGRSSSSPSSTIKISEIYPEVGGNSTSNSVGYYTYDDYLLEYNTNNKTKTKVIGAGTGASTTGTIYGIYDMSGGNWEYTMGNLENITGQSGFNVFPTKEYYDLYLYTLYKNILGDATWETQHWYSDRVIYLESDNPWMFRSGEPRHGTDTGIFWLDSDTGLSNWNSYFFTFRCVLIS